MMVIPALLTVGQCIAHIGKVLVPVAAHQLVIGLAVEPKAVFTLKLCVSDTYLQFASIAALLALHHTELHTVQVGLFWAP